MGFPRNMKIILEDRGRKDGKHWYRNWTTCWSSEETWLDSRQKKVDFLSVRGPDRLWDQSILLFNDLGCYPISKLGRWGGELTTLPPSSEVMND